MRFFTGKITHYKWIPPLTSTPLITFTPRKQELLQNIAITAERVSSLVYRCTNIFDYKREWKKIALRIGDSVW